MEPETLPPATVTEGPPPPTDGVPPSVLDDRPRPIANLAHTAILIIVLLVFSLGGANRQHQVATQHGKSILYGVTIAFEWILVGYVWLGIRRRGFGLRDLIGGDSGLERLLAKGLPEWGEMKARTRRVVLVGMDIAIGIGFWIFALAVLAGIGAAMGLMRANEASDFQQKIGFLAPKSGYDLLLFLALSASAGFCEEIIFRGYLQRQFTALSNSAALGIIAQAIIFGAGHGYEGWKRMILIAIYGTMFGILTYLRKSLKPGILAHFLHDGMAGIVLYVVAKKGLTLGR
jgi:uncharacterized protein